MHFSIICVGSHGDIRPYIALGAALKAKGHEVTIGTHRKAQALCEKYHLTFSLVDGDLTECISPERGHEMLWGGKCKKITNFINIMREFNKALTIQLPTSFKAVENADVLIYNPPAFAGPHLAEYFGIPSFLMTLQPEVRTQHHPSCFFRPLQQFGKWGNYLSHFLAEQQLWQPLRNKLNAWRTNTLGLRKMHFFGPPSDPYTKNTPTIVAFSPLLVPRPSDWGHHINMTSFCRIQNESQWDPPESLSTFLSSGDVLYIGFGSLTDSCLPTIVQKIVSVLIQHNIKTVINSQMPSLSDMILPAWIYPLDYAPHDWLFPKVKAVIHHGGVGTTAAGLYAGKPTFIIPFMVDQPQWGEMIHRKGIGPAPLHALMFNEKVFESRLLNLLAHQEYQDNATKIQKALLEENGVDDTVDVLLNWLKK